MQPLYLARALSLFMTLVVCVSLTSVAEAGLKKRGKALAVGGLAAAGVKNSKGKKESKTCPPPAEWPREFTEVDRKITAIGVVIASEQIQSKPSGCSAIQVRGGGETYVSAEVELYQGSKLNIWMAASNTQLKYLEEGNCIRLHIVKENVYKDNYLELSQPDNSCFEALYATSDLHGAYFESKSYSYGDESPTPHNDPRWVDDAKRAWSLLQLEQPFLGTMLLAYEEFMNGEDIHGEIPSYSNNDFKYICENRFDKAAQNLGKRMESEIGFEKCARNQDNVKKLMEWYHPDYKNYLASENWFHFDAWSAPVTSVWGDIGRGGNPSLTWRTKAPDDLTRRAKQQYRLRLQIMKIVRLSNMIIAARLDPSVPSYYAAYLSGAFSLERESMMKTTEKLFSVSSTSDVLNNIRAYQLTPSILRSYQELLEDPEDYDEVFTYYLENMDFATPSPEELYRKLYYRMAIVEACYEAKRGEIFVYMKSQQRDAARRGFNQAVKELSPQPNKDQVQVINARYDGEMQGIIDPLRAADYNGEMREWCVDSANYLANPVLRAMYQQAGL